MCHWVWFSNAELQLDTEMYSIAWKHKIEHLGKLHAAAQHAKTLLHWVSNEATTAELKMLMYYLIFCLFFDASSSALEQSMQGSAPNW